MRQSSTSRRALRFAVALAALVALGAFGTAACFGPEESVIWICLNPVNGKEDSKTHDYTHYVNGMYDPCHCYDPCGPQKSCPIVVDAGPPGPGCDAGP